MTVVITIKINYIIYNNNNNNNNNNNAETAHISIRLLHLSCAWILLKYSVYESYIVFDGKYVWIIYIVVINRKDHHNFQPWYQDGDGGGGGDGGGVGD